MTIDEEKCSYFKKGKFMNDYSEIFKDDKVESNLELLNVHGRMSKSAFFKNKANESYEKLQEQIENNMIWEVECEKDR